MVSRGIAHGMPRPVKRQCTRHATKKSNNVPHTPRSIRIYLAEDDDHHAGIQPIIILVPSFDDAPSSVCRRYDFSLSLLNDSSSASHVCRWADSHHLQHCYFLPPSLLLLLRFPSPCGLVPTTHRPCTPATSKKTRNKKQGCRYQRRKAFP